MHIVIYKSCPTKISQQFADQVESVIPKEDLEVYTEIEAYTNALKYPLQHRIITVLLVDKAENISQIVSKDILRDIHNIILITSREIAADKSISNHIHPRYIAYTDEPFDKVSLVLINMMIHMARNEQTQQSKDISINNT